VSPAERLAALIAAYIALVCLLWLAGRGITWAVSVRQGRRLDQARGRRR
jgi:hypothetical protein